MSDALEEKIRCVIDFPMFNAKVIFFIGEEFEPKRHSDCFDGKGYMARTSNTLVNGKRFVYVHCKTCSWGVIAHESIHAVSMILDGIGCKADFNNDEVQAYMVQYIVEKVMDKIYV